MNFRQIKYFVSVVQAGNMTRAARQLRVAQTALGMQIHQLEEDLGVALLTRHSRGVEPTMAGKLLYERALTILKLVEEAAKDVSACGREDSESIRLGMTPALMAIVGSEVVLAARKQLPQISLNIVEGMSHVLFDTLSRGDVDCILCYDVPDMPHFSRTALLQDDLVLVTLPGPEKGESIAFVDVLDQTLVSAGAGDTISAIVARTARERGLEFKSSFEVGSVSAQKDLVSRGVGSCIMPFFAVLDEVRAGTLHARPITMPAIRRTLFLAWSKNRGSFRSKADLTEAIGSSLNVLLDALGPLAHPLWKRTA